MICWKNKSSGRDRRMIAAPIEAKVTPLVLHSSINDPTGPRLAESMTSKSISFRFFVNHAHFNWPRASAVGSNKPDFAKPENIAIKALNMT